MANKYHSFNDFMEEVIKEANKLVGDLDSFFAIDREVLERLIKIHGLNQNEVKDIYYEKVLPQTVKEVGEKLLFKWKKAEGNNKEVDFLLEKAVIFLIKKVSYKQIQLLNNDYLKRMEYNQNQEIKEREIEDLMLYIKDAYPDLKLEREEKKHPLIKSFHNLKDCLIANPKEYYGKVVVTKDLIRDARNVAFIVTVSNCINFLFSSPVLYYAFSFLGKSFAVCATLGSGLGLQTFSNYTAAAVVGRKSNNKSLPAVATAGMLLINGVLTIGSGVGSELIMNQSRLAEEQAKKETDQYIQGLENAATEESSQYYNQYERLQKECTNGQKELESAGENNERSSRIYSRLYGDYKNRNNWDTLYPSSANINIEKIDSYPLCHRQKGYEAKVINEVKIAKEKLNNTLTVRRKLGNDIEFLEQEALEIYRNNFNENKELKSGSLAVEIALNSLWEKFTDGNISQLGFPLFLISLSLITSLIACLATISLSCRSDFLDSHSDIADREIDNWMNEKWLQLRNKQRNNLIELDRLDFEKDDNERKLFISYKSLIEKQGLNSDLNSLPNAVREALWIEKNYPEKKEDLYILQNQGDTLKTILENNENSLNNELDVDKFKKQIKLLLSIKERKEQDSSTFDKFKKQIKLLLGIKGKNERDSSTVDKTKNSSKVLSEDLKSSNYKYEENNSYHSSTSN